MKKYLTAVVVAGGILLLIVVTVLFWSKKEASKVTVLPSPTVTATPVGKKDTVLTLTPASSLSPSASISSIEDELKDIKIEDEDFSDLGL